MVAAFIYSQAMGSLKIDVTKCDACGGQMRKISAMTDSMQVRRYIKHEKQDPFGL